ncbi:unnamed protein product [Adineta steineri]|nr:unnamed protein product [Adineta steineri]
MVCLAAIDQFFSTSYQVYLRQLFTFKLARCLVFLLIPIWFLHSLLFAFFYSIHPSAGCIIWNVIWIRYTTFFFYPFLLGFLPIIFASSFSLLAYQNVRRIVRRQIPIERRRFDRQITAMVLVRVVFFVCLILPHCCYRIYLINTYFIQTNSLQYAIGQLIQVLAGSLTNAQYGISFYLYIIISPRYRRQVKSVLRKKIWQRWKNWCCTTQNQVAPEIHISTVSNLELM